MDSREAAGVLHHHRRQCHPVGPALRHQLGGATGAVSGGGVGEEASGTSGAVVGVVREGETIFNLQDVQAAGDISVSAVMKAVNTGGENPGAASAQERVKTDCVKKNNVWRT